MSCALAVGVLPSRVLDAIDAYGPKVFERKRLPNLRRALFGTLYDKENLARAVVEMLSIGTAGGDRIRAPEKASRSGLGWAPDLATFIIDVQESTASTQAAGLLGDRYLRVNRVGAPSKAFAAMDVANEGTRNALMKAGRDAAAAAYKSSGAFIDRFLSEDRKKPGFGALRGAASTPRGRTRKV